MARNPRPDVGRVAARARSTRSTAPTRCSCSLDGALIAARDPHGFRPLALASSATPRASPRRSAPSTCSARAGARARARRGGGRARAARPSRSACRAARRAKRCVFEHVYFARPDSVVFGDAVAEVAAPARRASSRARRPAVADIVVPVPDSGLFAAVGYSRESGLPFELGLIRNHYVGPHLHRAEAVDPPLRRQGEAQPGARDHRGQAASC